MSEDDKCPGCDYVGSPVKMFEHIANTRRGHGYKSAAEVLANAAGVRSYAGGFRDVSGKFEVAGLDVWIRPSAEVRRGGGAPPRHGRFVSRTVTHRIIVGCPTCSRQIPAGRMHQHLAVHSSRPFVCDAEGCSAAYGLAEHLRTHKRRSHSR